MLTEPGEPNADDELNTAIYRELRALARRKMAGERSDHTLQPTALVHETYLRLLSSGASTADRAHYFATAAVAMRHILVDHARRRAAIKRDGIKVSLDDVNPSTAPTHQQVLIVEQALTRLAEWDPRKAKLVELIYFGGLSEEEAAIVLEVSTRTVRRDWQSARAWLQAELKRKEE